jgi:molybdenum cofactor cytidylyltransferase
VATAGLVLAAGGGTRFGPAPKQLADFHGRPLLEWAVRAQCAVAELSRVMVVLGSHAAEVLSGVEFGRAETVVCEEWERGQAWSLRCGVAALGGGGGALCGGGGVLRGGGGALGGGGGVLRGGGGALGGGGGALRGGGDVSRVIVTLGDAPLVTPEVIRLFLDAPPRARAVYGGRPGHPVVLGPEEISALATLTGDQGARGLLRDGPQVEVGHLCSGRDIDTPEDLEEVRDEARAVI